MNNYYYLILFSLSGFFTYILLNKSKQKKTITNPPNKISLTKSPLKYVLVFDVDGTLTPYSGEAMLSAYNISIDVLRHPEQCKYLFGSQVQFEFMRVFLRGLVELVKGGEVSFYINSNNTSERINLIFRCLGVKLSDLIQDASICRTRDNSSVSYSKGDCLKKIIKHHQDDLQNPKNILFFEDDARYEPEIPKQISWINCQEGQQFLGALLEKHYQSPSSINKTNIKGFLGSIAKID
jgi:hypothetical protein